MKYLLLLLLSLTSCTSLSLMSSNDQKLGDDPIPGLLMDYFDTANLYPVIDHQSPLGLASYYEILKSQKGAKFIKAEIVQNEKHYEAVFGPRVLPSKNVGLTLFYLSSHPDCLPEPELFIDVVKQAYLLNPKIKEISGCKILIEPADVELEGSSAQIWTYFNPKEKIQTIVYLKPDGVGGTFFGVQSYPGDTE